MINTYVITIPKDELCDRAFRRLESSAPANLKIIRFDAVTPEKVDRLMKKHRLKWTYPWETQEYHLKTGLILNPYQTKNRGARMGCFLSHYLLWQRCVKNDEPIIINEHDAIWYQDEPPIADFAKSKYDIIGLNNPIGATRLAKAYDRVVQESLISDKDDFRLTENAVIRAPEIDDFNIPQGIAGNSSYYIEPSGAKKILDLVKEYGCWPNDAIMNRQLIPTLGQTKKYYTYVQGLRSTTTL